MKEQALENNNPYELLFATCQIVAHQQKIKLKKNYLKYENTDLNDFLHQIANAADIRIRNILLENGWWRKDNGNLLVFYKNQPAALIVRKRGGYTLIVKSYGIHTKLTENLVYEISTNAYCFYSAYPKKRLTIEKLLKFVYAKLRSELLACLILQILVNFLVVLAPFFLGLLAKSIIVGGRDLFWLSISAIGVDVGFICCLNYIISHQQLRLRFKLYALWAPALWDRILKFPAGFFRKQSISQLTFNAYIAAEIPQILNQLILSIFSIILLTLFALIGLYYLNIYLASYLTLFIIVLSLFMFYLHRQQSQKIHYWYAKYTALMEFTVEVLTGILKIRISNAASRIFAKWTFYLNKRTESEMKAQSSQIYLDIFIGIIILLSIFLLHTLVYLSHQSFELSIWIPFFALFLIFIFRFSRLNQFFDYMGELQHSWTQARAILFADTETAWGANELTDLKGKIELNNIIFGYHPTEKYLFRNLSMTISPGQCVAIVGPSGSGKSTLFRLLLGLERPQDGEILYDDIQIKHLKINSIRKQIGTVLQNSALIPGTILSNIIGINTQLTRRDAWEIAEKVGLANFIKLLPMQMDTIISEGPITLSGGEAQRLILARALSQNPKILFLDEATSALDNTTQAVIQHYLHELKLTQVIAAHRLSTIEHADIIYVLDKGSIVQRGTYPELMAAPGLFMELAKRQLK